VSFRPAGQGDLAPAGERAKLQANLLALRLLAALREQGRPAGPDEQAVLARWSGWGSLAPVFDPVRTEHNAVREQLAELLGPAGYRAASRTTLNAHYTDAALAQALWQALDEAGFAGTGGRVLEPGCGAGVFLGLAPAAATELIGVELDPTTAAIARLLYPDAHIRAESFADTRLPAGSVDLTVGNVPFGKISLHDPVCNAGGHSLHNHFILKALQLTRPGGVVAVLTSHWTLDATNPAARREMAALAELVTAIRLPSTAHEKAAGTRVLTDLLVLRRHDGPAGPDDQPGSAQDSGVLAWERAVPVQVADPTRAVAAASPGGPSVRPGRSGPAVNEVFTAHPEWVIGTPDVRLAQFGPALDVRFDGDVAGALHDRLRQALTAAGSRPNWALFTPPSRDATSPGRVLRQDAPAEHTEGHLAATDGAFAIVVDRQLRPHEVPAPQAPELTALLGLRDSTLALLTAEAANGQDTPELDGLRGQLNREYDAYAARYGPINRVTVRRTGRVDTDPTTGGQSERMARIRPPQGGFRADPHAPAVYALEHYDATTGTASKATITRGRVIAPRAPPAVPTPRPGCYQRQPRPDHSPALSSGPHAPRPAPPESGGSPLPPASLTPLSSTGRRRSPQDRQSARPRARQSRCVAAESAAPSPAHWQTAEPTRSPLATPAAPGPAALRPEVPGSSVHYLYLQHA